MKHVTISRDDGTVEKYKARQSDNWLAQFDMKICRLSTFDTIHSQIHYYGPSETSPGTQESQCSARLCFRLFHVRAQCAWAMATNSWLPWSALEKSSRARAQFIISTIHHSFIGFECCYLFHSILTIESFLLCWKKRLSMPSRVHAVANFSIRITASGATWSLPLVLRGKQNFEENKIYNLSFINTN